MKRKGFTLIELIITIMVVGIIAIIIFPTVKNITSGSKQQSYNTMIQNLKTSASLYSTEFEDDVKWFVSSDNNNLESNEEWSCLQINKLVESGFVKEPLINPIDNTEIDPNTLIEVRRNKVTHALNKDSITLETELCNGGYDSTPPVITIVLKYEDGTLYNGEWTDKNVVQTITASDGNGITDLKIFLNGTDINISENSITKTDKYWSTTLLQQSDISGNFEVEAKDYFTQATNNSYNINIDKTGPSCNIELAGTKTYSNNDWWTSNVTVTLQKVGLSINGYGLSKSSTATYPSTTTSLIQTENTASTIYYGYVKDALGRTNSCLKEVKKDSVTPIAPILTAYPSTFVKSKSSPSGIPPVSATFGVSGGTTSCTCNGTVCTNLNSVSNGTINIVCNSTANNGLSNSSSRSLTVRNCQSRSYCYTCGGYEYDECGNRITCPSCCECSSNSQCGTNYTCNGCSCVYNPPAPVCECSNNRQCNSYGQYYTCADRCTCTYNPPSYNDDDDDGGWVDSCPSGCGYCGAMYYCEDVISCSCKPAGGWTEDEIDDWLNGGN